QVAAVTGANEGIGFITARELHKKGCKVFLLCRNQEKAQDAIKRINEATPGQPDNLVFVPFDLTDIPSAKKAADAISNQVSRLDILVNNAGIMAWPYELKNGIEVQFSNHTGHFALTKHLLPLLVKTSKQPGSSVRIVNVSSMAHKFSPKPDFSSLDAVNREMRSTWERYGQSKLANILFSVALQDRLKDEKIYVNSLHPGNINTTLTRGPAASYGRVGMMQPLWNLFGMTPFEGAKTQLYLAGSHEVEEKNYRAMYFVPIATPASTTAYGQDEELAEQLWKLSE
ncbi:NAD(P)-binding protein, partial [Rhodotorula sp. JG-1b]